MCSSECLSHDEAWSVVEDGTDCCQEFGIDTRAVELLSALHEVFDALMPLDQMLAAEPV